MTFNQGKRFKYSNKIRAKKYSISTINLMNSFEVSLLVRSKYSILGLLKTFERDHDNEVISGTYNEENDETENIVY